MQQHLKKDGINAGGYCNENPPAYTDKLGFGYRTEKKYKFRTIHARSSIVGATTNNCITSDFTTMSVVLNFIYLLRSRIQRHTFKSPIKEFDTYVSAQASRIFLAAGISSGGM